MRKCKCYQKDLLKRRFNSDGRRLTAPRRAIIDFMHSDKGHFSAEEVLAGVRKKILYDPGLATVYRTLDLLDRSGIARRLDFGDGVARYELAENHSGAGHHHHLVCVSCGKIVEYADFVKEETDLLKKVEEELSRKHDFTIKGHMIQFYGECPSCSKKGENNMPRRDGTGPVGQGPAAGWGRGPCKKREGTEKETLRRRHGRGWKNQGDETFAVRKGNAMREEK